MALIRSNNMELHFTDELQKEILELVPNVHYRWLAHAVEYTKRVRRGYPDNFEAWTDDVTVDHILHYIDMCKLASRDATLDERNIVSLVNMHLQENPCRIRPRATPVAQIEAEQVELPEEVEQAMKAAMQKTSEVIDDGELAPPKAPKKKVTKRKTTKKKKVSKKKVSKKK